MISSIRRQHLMVLWWYDPTGPAHWQTGDWQKACSGDRERGEQDQRPHSMVVSSGDPLWNSDVRLERTALVLQIFLLMNTKWNKSRSGVHDNEHWWTHPPTLPNLYFISPLAMYELPTQAMAFRELKLEPVRKHWTVQPCSNYQIWGVVFSK